MKTPAGTLTLSSEEGEVLIAHVHQSNMPAAVVGRVAQIIRLYVWVVCALQEATLSVKRLRHLLLGSRAQPKDRSASEVAATASEAPGQAAGAEMAAPGAEVAAPGAEVVPCLETRGRAAGAGAAESEAKPKPQGGHRPGTGRGGAAAYTGATRVECRHEAVAVGQRCPVCGHGTFYALPAGVEIGVDGQALLRAMPYALDKLRCSACGQIFTAGVPAGVGQEKYSARAVLGVSRYYLGLPLYRVEAYQAMLGVPVPDATQWDQIEQVGDCADVVFEQLEHGAAQGEWILHDDTAVRILALIQENSARLAAAQVPGGAAPQERTGMRTTALVVQVGEHTAILYYSSRRQAGENLQELPEKREAGLATPLARSEALASNAVPKEAAGIRCHCLAHGRRKFSDLAEGFPHACQVVLEVLRQVFEHDEQARAERLSPEARLAYHQARSRPLMDILNTWLDTQLAERLVEPNSALGKAIVYMQSHWDTLPRFLLVPGAPLDNTLAERVLQLCIRQRNNSFFDKNEHSADMASILTSLIATCLYAGVNAVEYRVALQEHRADVCADPAAWVPWTSQARLAPP